MAAYTFVAAGSSAGGTGALTPGQPAGKAAGHLLLLATAARTATETLNAAPSGWTLLADTNTTTNDSLALYGRIATNDASDDVNHDFWSGSSSAAAQIAAFSGNVHTTLATIVAHSAFSGNNGNVSDIPNPALTISTADTLVIGVGKKSKTATSDGATITSPAGLANRIGLRWSAGSVVGLVWDYTQQTTATNIANSIWDQSVEESLPYASLVVALKTNPVVAPSFTSGPTVNSQTDTAYTTGYTPNLGGDTDVDVYLAAVPAGASTPSAAQIKAGTGGGIVNAASELGVTGADTLVLTITATPPNPKYKLCFVLENSAGFSSVSTLDNEMLDAPTGKEFTTVVMREITGVTQANPAVVTSTGHGLATGDEVRIWDVAGMTQLNGNYYTITVVNANSFSLNSTNSTGYGAYTSGGFVSLGDSVLYGASPDATDGDIIVSDTAMSPGGYAADMRADGGFGFDPGTDTSRQELNAALYRSAVGEYHGGAYAETTFYVGNSVPTLQEPNTDPQERSYLEDTAITPEDLTLLVTDADGDIPSHVIDTLPAGLSESGNSVSGTPTTPGITRATDTVTDVAGDSFSFGITYIIRKARPFVIGSQEDLTLTADEAMEAVDYATDFDHDTDDAMTFTLLQRGAGAVETTAVGAGIDSRALTVADASGISVGDYLNGRLVVAKYANDLELATALTWDDGEDIFLATTSAASIAGLALSSAGELTGTPTSAAFTEDLIVRAEDSDGDIADSAPFALTVNPAPAVLTETFIDEFRAPRANLTGITVLIWRSAEPIGPPHVTLVDQTTDGDGVTVWGFDPGSLEEGDPVFYLAYSGSPPGNFTAGRVTPTLPP